ncbi:MAG: spore cortex biosynthesis protein YabQ, partial [Clostridia bacterium]|nr:spore cortex biosynthesis protein YabQ [Clostridia bacterium]
MYSFEQSKQLDLFFLSLGTGFFLGIIYDILRAIRLTLSGGKAIIFIFDILYFVISALATFMFFVAINKGEFRFYMIFGEILGLLFYYFSFGIAAKSFTNKFV